MNHEIKNCKHRRIHKEIHIYGDRLFIEYQHIDSDELCSITGLRCESCDDVYLVNCPAFELEFTPGVCNMGEQCEKCSGVWHWFSDDGNTMICDNEECKEVTEL